MSLQREAKLVARRLQRPPDLQLPEVLERVPRTSLHRQASLKHSLSSSLHFISTQLSRLLNSSSMMPDQRPLCRPLRLRSLVTPTPAERLPRQRRRHGDLAHYNPNESSEPHTSVTAMATEQGGTEITELSWLMDTFLRKLKDT